MTTLTTKAREGMTSDMVRAADEMIAELMDLGPEGAAQVALMASMTDTEFQTVVTLWGQKGTAATDAFVSSVETHTPPLVQVAVDTWVAEQDVRTWIQQQRVMSILVRATLPDLNGATSGSGRYGFASGGPIPGSSPHPRADNITIRATAGEYLHQVPAVNYWGGGFMDAVNRMDKAAVVSQVAGYAYGGQVGVPVYVGGPHGGGSVASATSAPIDYDRLARAMSHVQIGLNGQVVSQSVDQWIGARVR